MHTDTITKIFAPITGITRDFGTYLAADSRHVQPNKRKRPDYFLIAEQQATAFYPVVALSLNGIQNAFYSAGK
jgi:hypothetical protein